MRPRRAPRRGKRAPREQWALLPYSSRVFLLTLAERRFFLALREALSPYFHICPKVRVADVIHCPPDLWRRFGGAISQKHFDFVLAHPESFRVACCIELDDSSHQQLSRRNRDAFLDASLLTAQVPLLRYRVRREYNCEALRRRVFATLRRAARTRT